MPDSSAILAGTKAFIRLRSWCQSLADEVRGADAAVSACARWFDNAARGVETAFGPYELLYTAAAHELWANGGAFDEGSVQNLLAKIPAPGGQQYQDLSRLYSIFYMAALHGEWTEEEITIMSNRIVGVPQHPWLGTREIRMAIMEGDAGPFLRRAVEVLDQHTCVGSDACSKASILWEDEDARSAFWVLDRF